jgi:hypothetical protein
MRWGRIGIRPLCSAVGAFAILAAGCETRAVAYGDANSVIAVMAPERWEEFSDEILAALERTIVTVRDEKTFTVTYQEPYGDRWSEMSRFRNLLLVGEAGDRWVREALAGVDPPVTDPGVHRARDVWSRGQSVTVIVLGPDPAEEMAAHLPVVYAQLDQDFRAFARSRMYQTGVDTALADTLLGQAGFRVLVPVVYRWTRADSTYVFRNDNPDPAELIREVSVSRASGPVPAELSPDSVLAWRARVVASYYSEPQDLVRDATTSGRVEVADYVALEVRGQWTNPPNRGWPAGGPFIARAVVCDGPSRAYLLDAWLYAPGLEKYEYMIQLETILDTFRCD